MSFIVPNQTSFSTFKPSYSGSTWVRPSDWITITDTAKEVQYLVSDIVYPIYTIRTSFNRPASQNCYIDWGDGVVDTISTGAATDTSHTYTTGGTPCSLGYNTWKIRIWTDSGADFTSVKPITTTSFWGSGVVGADGMLEAYYGDNMPYYANFTGVLTGQDCKHNFLQYVKLPSVITDPASNLGSAFVNCYNLAKVVMPTSMSGCTSMAGTFLGCYSLQEVILPSDMTIVASMNEAFRFCYTLTNVVLPPTINVACTFNLTFNQCYALGRINFPSTPLSYVFSSTFLTCSSLLEVEIKSWSSSVQSGATPFNLSSMFSQCRALESVKLPTTSAAGSLFNVSDMFNGCYNLKSFTQFPTNFDCTSVARMFNICYSIGKITFPSSVPSLNTFTSAFAGCSQLTDLTLPNQNLTIASVNLDTAFNNAAALSEIYIPSGWTISSYLSTFNGCNGLKKATLPANIAANTTCASMFLNCYSLEQVVMPTNMAGCTTLANAFQNCTSLENITLPSSMNSCTTMALAFATCTSLKTITLPTSASALITCNSMFSNCVMLRSITMPATTGNITTYANAFQNTDSLETLVLPTTTSTNLTSLNTTFNLGYRLKTLTNEEYLGNSGTTSAIYVDATTMGSRNYELTSLDFYTKFSKFEWNGLGASRLNNLTSLRLRNNGSGQYAGTSPQINIQYNSLGQAALVQVFNDLPTITAKTINITGNPGAPLLTAGERAIATGKGWTIVG